MGIRLLDDASKAYQDMERQYFGEDMHESAEIRLLPSVLEGVKVFVDVGASLGQYAFFAGESLTDATIFCIEADPGKAKYLEHLTQRWSQQQGNRYVVLNKGCSDQNEEIDFYIPKDHKTSGAFFPLDCLGRVDDDWDRTSIPCVTLDELFKDTPVDFIKVDVEGAELRVMRGATSLLERCSPTVLLEVAPWGDLELGSRPSAVFTFMAEHGYDFEVFENHWLFRRTSSPWTARVRARVTGFVLDHPIVKNPLKRVWVSVRALRRRLR